MKDELISAALHVVEEAYAEYQPSHVFALFSGGHDSLCATAIAARHPAFSGAAHMNTGVGIEATREFVRSTCAEREWPLLEYHPDGKTYRELVIEKGMPNGPKSHNTMYFWLKQRQVRRLVREHKTHRHDRVMLVTGIRTDESTRRMAAALSVPVRREGCQLWVNPILDWSKSDCHDLMDEDGLVRNQVVDLLHRSGECLCGSLANRLVEMPEIERWYPETAAELRRYEELAREHGHLEDVWARRLPAKINRMQTRLELCSSCDVT